MDKFDRNAQRKLLQYLCDAYPYPISVEQVSKIAELFDDEIALVSNLMYLEEHGLISNAVSHTLCGITPNTAELSITKDGIDFILDDGGLSAILNVVTIRFHHETITDLIKIVENSHEGTAEEKKDVISKLKSLSSEATKQLMSQLIALGLQKMPDVFHLIQTILQKV